MSRLQLTRRAVCAGATLLCAVGARAEPLNPGRFQAFVDANRIDPEIGHVLNVLGSYPPGSWSRASSDFAYAQLASGNLLGIARAGTALARIAPQLLPRFSLEMATLGENVSHVGPTGGFTGYTQPVSRDGAFKYILVNDASVLNGTQPGPGRERLAETLVHELNHARNGPQLMQLQRDTTPTPARYVDPALAATTGGQASMQDFVAELAAAHTAWRCLQEWDNRWRGTPIRRTVPPGALYQFAIEQAQNERGRGRYLQALISRPFPPGSPEPLNQQTAIWMHLVRALTFVDDAAENMKATNLIDGAAAFAAARGFTSPIEPADGALNYWSPRR